MPIILSETDLMPLLDTPARMDELLPLIEDSMRAQSSGVSRRPGADRNQLA
jgi:hypothetical protein